MKTRNLLMMGMVAVAMMLGGCAETDNDMMEMAPAVKDGQTVKINVVDNGYGDVTRAAESNDEEVQGENTIMQTNFIAGDKIGVFSISAGGAVHYNNLELRYNGTEWVNPDGETFYYFTGMRYYAYYPYNPDFDSENGVDWSAEGVDAFFAPYVTDWQPQEDQSTTKQYMASDLMVGAGAMSGETFTFSMGHTMGLIFISVAEEIKGTIFLFPKLTEADAIDSLNADSKIFTFEQKVYKPSRKQGYYRYIVKPGGNPTFISGANPDGRLFSFTCDNVSGGHYKKYIVYGGFDPSKCEIKPFVVEIGDVMLNDYSFVRRPADGTTIYATYGSTINNKKLGVVAYLAESDDEYTEGFTHGLILKTSVDYKNQFTYSQYASYTDTELTNFTTVKDALKDKSGLSNSLLHWSLFSQSSTNEKNRIFEYQLTALTGKVSNWFLPSVGQWGKIISDIGCTISPNGTITYDHGMTNNFAADINTLFASISVKPGEAYSSNSNAWRGFVSSTEATTSGLSLYKVVFNTTPPSFSTYGKESQYVNFWRAAAF